LKACVGRVRISLMNTRILFALLVLAMAGCGSSPTRSTDVREDLDGEWKDRVGKATKSDLIEKFGNAEWCRPQESGSETCRFYRKVGTKWTGEKLDRKHYEQFDEVVADFGSDGKLRAYKANAQR